MSDARRQFAVLLAVAATVWGVWAALASPSWTASILVFAAFVIVPLGLQLASHAESGPLSRALPRLAWLAPVLALSPALSYSIDPGTLAAVAAIPWLCLTLIIALLGAGRLLSRRAVADPLVAVDFGLMFLLVGGVWMVISRAGWTPMGFSAAIVELTAVHFHYAGFALPVVAGLVASRREASVVVPVAVILGIPLTALGISFGGGWLEWSTATFMALAGMATATMLLGQAGRTSGLARWLLGAAGTCLLAGMFFSLGWAWSMRFGWKFLAIDEMAATHGSLNALGFGLLALIGLTLSTPAVTQRSLLGVHLGRPPLDRLQWIAECAAAHKPTSPPGMLDRPTPPGFRRDVWERNLQHTDFDAAKAAIRNWAGHRCGGVSHWPERPEIALGTTIALGVPAGPLAVTASTRIIDVVDEADRFGFTYATLPHHPEDGEESFVVSRRDDGTLDLTITAVSRQSTVAARMCPPISHFFQQRIVDRYLDGLAKPPG